MQTQSLSRIASRTSFEQGLTNSEPAGAAGEASRNEAEDVSASRSASAAGPDTWLACGALADERQIQPLTSASVAVSGPAMTSVDSGARLRQASISPSLGSAGAEQSTAADGSGSEHLKSSPETHADAQAASELLYPDIVKSTQQQAAVQIQAACRGYLARRRQGQAA